MKFGLTLLTLTAALTAEGWSPALKPFSVVSTTTMATPQTLLYAASDDNKDDDEDMSDALEERLKKLEEIGDNLKGFAKIDDAPTTAGNSPKLGIDIGSRLTPLSDKEAAELKAAAMEVINDGVAEGIDEIEKLRGNMNEFIDKQKAQMELKSDLELKKQEKKLMSKIDKMTGDFLTKTQATREETKLVAKADRSSEGQGLEVGVWGVIGGAAVETTGSQNVGLLGSVDAAISAAEKEAKKLKDAEMSDLKISAGAVEEEAVEINSNRVIIIADTSQVRPKNSPIIVLLGSTPSSHF